MRELYGQDNDTIIILHGGAGGQDPRSPDALSQASKTLEIIAEKACEEARSNSGPMDIVVSCLKALELDEQFNAGRGSALQADGQARLTAAVMNGPLGTFSGVMGATFLIHPSVLASYLQTQRSRVLSSPGIDLLARQLGLPVDSPLSRKNISKWQHKARIRQSFCDTVGVILRTSEGEMYVGTSTGGRGYEFPGRVSDSATVAGTYATQFAAVSATGVGEEIVDDALAARLETRCRDGLSLKAASKKCLEEALARNRSYGWIAADCKGSWSVVHTTPAMSFAVYGVHRGKIASSFTGSEIE